LSSTDLEIHFDEHGFVRLRGCFAARDAAVMADAVWAELTRKHGIVGDDRSTWTVAEPRGLGALRKRGAFDAVATPAIRAAISTLVGRNDWPPPLSWGDPLVTLPRTGDWDVPTGGWHIDFPARGAPGSILLLKWLGYLASVPARGGGTVVLAGSHRLVERYLRQADPSDMGRSPKLRDAIFESHPWLRSIRRPDAPADRAARLMKDGATVDGIGVRVIELTGQPGDIVFMHPHLFHAPAPNHASMPRLMITGGLAMPTTAQQ
jgi:ectoine hydroxylase-related dioxygenase (phytanoyl-CoA dioxygenase family)